jgi:predicted transcriptional regulator
MWIGSDKFIMEHSYRLECSFFIEGEYMTNMQFIVLASIHEYISENDKCPTIRDIACDLDKSTATIHYHLKKLSKLGFVNITKTGRIIGICQK